jgi:hypothetical protein
MAERLCGNVCCRNYRAGLGWQRCLPLYNRRAFTVSLTRGIYMRHVCPGRRTLIAFCVLSLLPRISSAQSTASGLSPRQVLIGLTNAAGEGAGVSNIGEVIADLVGLEVSTAPIGSSAGGFTFTFNPATRAFTRAAPSFGPMFGERAITAGTGRASVGVNYIHASYDTLDGVNIRDGSLQTVTFVGGSAPPRGTAALHLSTDTVVVFTNIALNRWFDAGVAVPFVTLKLDGTHRVTGTEDVAGSASESGLGDVALRGKIRVYPYEQGGVAVGLELRVPTGDKEALLGAGVARTLVSGIWSGTVGPIVPHASLGFEYWSQPFQVFQPLQQTTVDAGRHGVAYNAGLEWAATQRLTVNAELLGRTLRNGGRLAYTSLNINPNPFGIRSAEVASVDPRGLHEASIAGGIKWNFGGTALLTASVLLPVNDAGLRDKLTPVVGLDWGF